MVAMVIQLNTTEQYASKWLHLQVSSFSVFCYNLKSLNVSKEWGRWTAKEGPPIGAKVTGSAREMSLSPPAGSGVEEACGWSQRAAWWVEQVERRC